MATAQELEAALVNADKAGDTAAATALANELVKVRSAPKPEATATDRVNAVITGANRGIAGLVGLPMDTAQNVYNLAKAGVGTIATAAGRPDLAPELSSGNIGTSEWIANKLRKYGIGVDNPRPDDAASRMLYRGGVVAGGAGPAAIRNPGAVLASGTGAAVGGEVSDNPLAPALGSMVPAVAGQVATTARQSVADRMKPQMEAFKEAGAQPSVGQATRLNFIQGFENLLSKFPGGQGVFRKFVETQQKDLSKNTATGVSAEDAGRTIEKGVGGFLDRTKATWQQLDDKLYKKVGDAQVTPSYTLSTLDKLTSAPQGAENVSKVLNNPRLVEIKAQILKDIQGTTDAATPVIGGYSGRKIGETVTPGTPGTGTLPFGTLRELRTKVGSLLDNSLVSGVPNGELKQLYGALSKDLEFAAKGAGASQDFARQSNYYRARMDRVETVLERVLGKGRQPEDIFKAVNPTDPNQSNKLRAVMRSLEPSERQVVTNAVVQRLGRATPGRQNDVGDVFSSETFLTNWNRLSPEAKSQLFPNAAQRKNLMALATVADDIRSGGKVFANPSGTAGAVAPYGLGYLAASGQVGQAATLIAGSFIGSKMLTSPKVVDWLAQAPKVKPENTAAYLARLGVIANETKDDALRDELTQYVNSVSKSVSAQSTPAASR